MFGAYAVLGGMSPQVAARLQPRAIPADSFWSDVLQDSVLTIYDPLGRSYPRSPQESAERSDRSIMSSVNPHPALREFAALPLQSQIEKIARMARSRHDNQRLALRRRLRLERDNQDAIQDNWSQVTAADLIDDIILREQKERFLKFIRVKLAQEDFHLLLEIVTNEMLTPIRAAQLGFASVIEVRNALRRIRTASKTVLSQLQEMDDDQ